MEAAETHDKQLADYCRLVLFGELEAAQVTMESVEQIVASLHKNNAQNQLCTDCSLVTAQRRLAARIKETQQRIRDGVVPEEARLDRLGLIANLMPEVIDNCISNMTDDEAVVILKQWFEGRQRLHERNERSRR